MHPSLIQRVHCINIIVLCQSKAFSVCLIGKGQCCIQT